MSRNRAKQKKRFLDIHPHCCLCGGSVDATTVEHAPPRILFVHKKVPGAFEFPACKRCNGDSSGADQIAAVSVQIMGACMSPHIPQAKLNKLLTEVSSNHPDFIKHIGDSGSAEYIRVNGLLREVFKVDIDRRVFYRWLDPWGAKLGLAFWYKHTGKILPNSGKIAVHWFTNTSILEDGIPDQIISQLRGLNWISQGKITTQDQFFYKYGLGGKNDFASFLFSFHDASAAWVTVFEDAELARHFYKVPIFETSAETGIQHFSLPIGYLH